MLTLDAAVQSALVGGCTALIVALLNNYFVHRSKENERRHRRREWFLEKQARDAEEIISTLERFTKSISANFKELDFLSSNVGVLTEVSDEEMTTTFEKGRKEYENSSDSLTNEMYSDRRLQEAWFEYDAFRLTVWFAQSAQTSEKLSHLGERFIGVQKAMMMSAALCSDIASMRASDRQKIYKCVLEEKRSARKDWYVLLEETAIVQRGLAADLLESGSS